MTPAARSLTPHRRRLAGAAATAAACLALVGCGGPAEPGVAPSTTASPAVSAATPDPTPSADAADPVVVDIRIADGKVSPNGEKVAVAVGQEVVVNVTSDADDEIHAHTDDVDGYELEVKAGVPTTGRFTVASAGSFEVESHHLEKIIVILNVR
ncbi:MAG TPA: hypothetical protein VIT41_03785 [Microlunatus sp.]